MVLLLTESDVQDLVDLQAAIACFTRTFAEQGRGELASWAPLHLTGPGANLQLRAGGLLAAGRMGVRVSTGASGSAFVALHELPSGRLLSVMGYPFSNLRLDACVAVGVEALARPGAARVGMLGAGSRALGLLRAICAVRPVQTVAVYSPTPAHRTSFAEEAAHALDLPVRAVDEPTAAVADADIVVVMTNALTPALHGAWLPADVLVVAAGQRSELDETVLLRAGLTVTTSLEQELGGPQATDEWTLVRMTRSGALPRERIVELGEVITGRITPPTGITVFREAQGGFTDIALAALAYDRAVELGRGIAWAGP
ncbi:MAG: hypothetical protein QOF51_1369 [Chloroflexota bacterium]|nr:hypothetical protein [Chloroflexota bacterium]